MKIFWAYCKIGDGERVKFCKLITKAVSEDQARSVIVNHYAIAYDETCEIIRIEEYRLAFGDVVEIK